jgi:hypothetical protein
MLSFKSKTVQLLCLVVAVGTALCAQAANTITAAEASKHVGETATVCGVVVSAHFAATSRGRPTFLNLDEPYPRQIFTIVIWGSDRGKFGASETAYKGKRICVTGGIDSYRGVPQIVAHDPAQISSQKE